MLYVKILQIAFYIREVLHGNLSVSIAEDRQPSLVTSNTCESLHSNPACCLTLSFCSLQNNSPSWPPASGGQNLALQVFQADLGHLVLQGLLGKTASQDSLVPVACLALKVPLVRSVVKVRKVRNSGAGFQGLAGNALLVLGVTLHNWNLAFSHINCIKIRLGFLSFPCCVTNNSQCQRQPTFKSPFYLLSTAEQQQNQSSSGQAIEFTVVVYDIRLSEAQRGDKHVNPLSEGFQHLIFESVEPWEWCFFFFPPLDYRLLINNIQVWMSNRSCIRYLTCFLPLFLQLPQWLKGTLAGLSKTCL